MSERVVLPKFDLPGQGPHPAVRALWIAGGLLALSMLVLGGALWRHHGKQLAAEAEAQALIATRAADAAAAVDAAKAQAAARLAAKKAVGKTAGAQPGHVAQDPARSADGASAPVAAAEPHRASSRHHGAGHHGSSKSAAKIPAKTGALAKGDTHKSSVASNKKKDDAIDKLLAQFK